MVDNNFMTIINLPQTEKMVNKDQRLINGIINGEQEVLKHFYRDNIYYVRNYILRNSGNMEDVEDIFQDALVVLYQKLRSGRIEIHAPVRTYFYGICKNLWLTRLRKKEKLIINDDNGLEERLTNEVLENQENQEREHLYQKHFQKLSPDNKQLLHLFFEGKSMKEISKICGYSEGYARKKKFDAKKKLFAMIEDDPMYRELSAC